MKCFSYAFLSYVPTFLLDLARTSKDNNNSNRLSAFRLNLNAREKQEKNTKQKPRKTQRNAKRNVAQRNDCVRQKV